MKQEELVELLSAHAAALASGQKASFYRSHPLLEEETEALLALAEQLEQILVPVPMRAAFRGWLYGKMVGQGKRQRLPRRSVWLGTAALAFLVLFWRRQQQGERSFSPLRFVPGL